MKTKIPAKNLKGDDGYVTFSVRIKNSVVASLDEKARESGRSRNYVIGKILEAGVEEAVIVDPDES